MWQITEAGRLLCKVIHLVKDKSENHEFSLTLNLEDINPTITATSNENFVEVFKVP